MKHKHSLIRCLLGILILCILEQPGGIHASDLIGIEQTGVEPLDIIQHKSLKIIPEIEASGLLYLKDLNRYAVISDETQDRRPVLYLMDRHGYVDQTAAISGLDEINDMEAVCKGENSDIYITCSQSPNKKGRISDSRKLFIRIERNGMNFHLKNRIFLYDLLLESLIHSNNSELKWIMSADNRGIDIDIEGMFFHQGSIFLGLKKPLKRNQAVILIIKNINQVLAENRIKSNAVTLWRTLNLKDRATGISSGISDLCLYENRLLILSFAKIKNDSCLRKSGLKKMGKLWAYDLDSGQLSLMETFKNKQPEGVALRYDAGDTDAKNDQAIAIIFDGGGKEPSQFMEFLPELNR